MAGVHRSSRAEVDFVEIWGHIAKDDPLAADRQLDWTDAVCEMLAENPQAGPRREDLSRGLRFYPVGDYLIFYTVGNDGITWRGCASRCAGLPASVPLTPEQ